MEGSAAFLLGVLLLGVSCFIHLVGVELEKVGDDFGFGRIGRKAVGGEHGAVVRLVRGDELGEEIHLVAVHLRKRRIRVFGASIKDGLACQFYLLPQRLQSFIAILCILCGNLPQTVSTHALWTLLIRTPK